MFKWAKGTETRRGDRDYSDAKKKQLTHGGGTQAACINIMKRREDEWDRDDPGLSLFNL